MKHPTAARHALGGALIAATLIAAGCATSYQQYDAPSWVATHAGQRGDSYQVVGYGSSDSGDWRAARDESIRDAELQLLRQAGVQVGSVLRHELSDAGGGETESRLVEISQEVSLGTLNGMDILDMDIHRDREGRVTAYTKASLHVSRMSDLRRSAQEINQSVTNEFGFRDLMGDRWEVTARGVGRSRASGASGYRRAETKARHEALNDAAEQIAQELGVSKITVESSSHHGARVLRAVDAEIETSIVDTQVERDGNEVTVKIEMVGRAHSAPESLSEGS